MATDKVSEKPTARASKSSIWLVTINPNRCYRCSTSKCFKSMYHALDAAALSVGNNLQDYLEITPAGQKRGDKLTSEFIKKLKYKWVIEQGEEQGRLHTHLYIYARHKTLLRLNYATIKKAFIDALGCPVYMNAKVSANATQNFENYLEKSRRPKAITPLIEQ